MKINDGCVIWIMGLAGSGKSTIGKELYKEIKKLIPNVIYLDGDELRDILGFYGYDKQSRIEIAIKRSKIANFLSKQGIVVIVTTISLFNEIYEFNRKTIKNYIEVYIKCSINELIKRDQKGLYSAKNNGKINNIVGIDINPDKPNPMIEIDNTEKKYANYKAKIILKSKIISSNNNFIKSF